jgi:hypothetical protein
LQGAKQGESKGIKDTAAGCTNANTDADNAVNIHTNVAFNTHINAMP